MFLSLLHLKTFAYFSANQLIAQVNNSVKTARCLRCFSTLDWQDGADLKVKTISKSISKIIVISCRIMITIRLMAMQQRVCWKEKKNKSTMAALLSAPTPHPPFFFFLIAQQIPITFSK